jgi:hypothetical protein
MRRPVLLTSCLAGAIVALLAASAGAADAPVHVSTFLSPAYELDQVYRSMKGPRSRKEIFVRETEEPELLWITGFEAEVVRDGDEEKSLPEYMCHANLGFARMNEHRELFQLAQQGRRKGRIRLFTLSQGQMEVRFPPGFGVPVASDEPLWMTTQVLNLNEPAPQIEVRHKTTIEYVRDSELETPMKPLFQKAAQGMVLIEGRDAYYDVAHANPEEHGPGCQVGARAGGKNIHDGFGREFSAHWKVPPGRDVNHTLVTQWMDLPFDTTVHHIAVHLHPFASSLELRDLTADTTVFRSEVENSAGKIGIERVESFSSEEGIPVYADHEYELVSVYENTSAEDQDSMAIMFLYMLDREFIRPKLDRGS